MTLPVLYSFRRCPYAMRARMALILTSHTCELREILLTDKPDSMLEISPKGTVPVLQLEGRIIDESMDIIKWAIKSGSEKMHILSEDEEAMSNSLIQLFDSKFKYHLDRYKYSSRYQTLKEEHQEKCLEILNSLEQKISDQPWIFGKLVSLLDISILPFIRQCKIANPAWFKSQKFKRVISLLEHFESSELFNKAMEEFELWDPKKSKVLIFPSSEL
jgi:glutathione S-transferase|tara:strand:- start:179 stop:829 length:651 start_codon:yes stop_codon:yes gene_type:complete